MWSRRVMKEHEAQRSGVAPSVVAFGEKVTKSKIPEQSIGCRCEFVAAQCYRSLLSCRCYTAHITAVVFIYSNVPVGGRNGMMGSGQGCGQFGRVLHNG